MSEANDNDDQNSPAEGPEKKVFDIYHFMSRKDMLLAGLLILALLFLLLWLAFWSAPA